MNPFDQWNAQADVADPSQVFVPKQQKKPKKNFWLDQISTGGSILGGIAGSFVTPLAGTAAGSAIGGGLGEALENIIMGEKLGKNVASEAALSGLFGAGPLRLGKAALGTRAALKSGAATSLKEAAKIGAKEGAEFSLRGAVGRKVAEASDKLLIKQFRLTPSQLSNFSKRHGEDAVKVLKRYGIQQADDVVAKGIQPLQNAFDDVITQIPAVSKTSLSRGLKSVYQPLIKSSNLSEQRLGQQIQQQADEIIKNAGKAVPASEVNTLRKSFDDFVNYTMRGTPEHNVNKMTADALRKTLQNAADKAGIGYQGKTFKQIGKDLSKLYDLDEIVGRQANLGRGSSPLGLTTLLGGAAGGAGGPLGIAGGAAATAAINSPVGRRLATRGAEGLGNQLLESGQRSAGNAFKPGGIATRLGGIGAVRGLANQQPENLEDAMLQSQSMNSPTSPMTDPMSMPNNMDQSYQQTPQQSSPYPRENLLMDIQRDPANAEQYMQYYAMFEELFPSEAEGLKLGNPAIARISDFESGIAALDDLEGRILESGVNQPFIGDIRRQNPYDTGAQDLNSTIRSVRQLVGRALEGGVLRREDEIKYEQMLPKIGDTDDVARAKIANVRRLLTGNLSAYQANQQTYSGGGGGLDEALIQAQGAY